MGCSSGACSTMVTLPTMHSTQPSTQNTFSRSFSSQCASTALRGRGQAQRSVGGWKPTAAEHQATRWLTEEKLCSVVEIMVKHCRLRAACEEIDGRNTAFCLLTCDNAGTGPGAG